MEHIKSFSQFVGEDAVKAEDSKVYIDNLYVMSLDRDIKAGEILGIIKSSETESEFVEYFYKEYGNGAFTEEEVATLSRYFNEYTEEDNLDAAEKEEDKEKEPSEEGGEEGGEEGDDVVGVSPEDLEVLENSI